MTITKKTSIAIASIIGVLFVALIIIATSITVSGEADAAENQVEPVLHEEYVNYQEWRDAVMQERANFEPGTAETVIADLGDYITEEQAAALTDYENKIRNGATIEEIQMLKNEFNETVAQLQDQKQEKIAAEEAAKKAAEEEAAWKAAAEKEAKAKAQSSSGGSQPSGSLTALKSAGRWNLGDGHTCTWYSSRVLHHYRTNEFTLGDDGIYRYNGMICVAYDGLSNGSTITVPRLGTCYVMDKGAGGGNLDVYVNW